MLESMSFIATEGNFVYLNLLLQITFLSLASIVLASQFKNNAVIRYALLYSTLLSLILLCASSVFVQARGASFLQFYIGSPVAYLNQLYPGVDGVAPILPELQIPEASLDISANSGLQPNNLSLSSIFNVFDLPNFKLPLFMLLQMLWISGFFVATIGLLRSIHNADRIARRSTKLSANEYQLFNSVLSQGRFGISRLHCRKSVDIQSPVLIGITSPILLVPVGFFESFKESDIRAILCHEVAHVMRRDPVFNFLQKLILTVFWFHPLVHQMDKMLSRAREEICDNYVLSQEPAVQYGEVLLRLNLSQSSIPGDVNNVFQSDVVLGVFNSDWNLEERISDLLSQKREILMQLSQRSTVILNVAVVAAALTISACQVAAQDDMSQPRDLEVAGQALTQNDRENAVTGQNNLNENRSERKQSTDSRVPQTLGPRIAEAISEIQELMKPTTDLQPDMDLAKDRLDTLYEERFERMNDFEKQTLLSFYTNYYLSLEDYFEATNTFEQMLTLENLREDIQLRVLRSLGQLHASLENWDESIGYYEQWQTASEQTDLTVLRGLSYAEYQLEEFSDALTHWLAYMDVQLEEGAEPNRENYSYLNGLYYTLEQWDDALETTKEMILLYNTPKDWENLRAIYRKLDEQNPVSPDAGAL